MNTWVLITESRTVLAEAMSS